MAEDDNDLAKPLLCANLYDAEDSAVGEDIHQLTEQEESWLSLPIASAATSTNDEGTRLKILSSWKDHILLLVVLPFLLTVQFAMALKDTRYNGNTGSVDPLSQFGFSIQDIFPVIALYVLAAYVYKGSLQDSRWVKESALRKPPDNDTAVTQYRLHLAALVPEIIMDVVLGMVVLVSVPAAAFVLVLATILLAASGILLTLHTIYYSN